MVQKKRTAPYKKTTSEFSFVLRPSSVQGIGVFTTHAIKKGVRLRLFPKEVSRLIKKLPCTSENIFKHYCITSPGGLYCPSDFGKMAIGWYLNHSSRPNIFHKDYTYFAKCDIGAGEELTVNYNTL